MSDALQDDDVFDSLMHIVEHVRRNPAAAAAAAAPDGGQADTPAEPAEKAPGPKEKGARVDKVKEAALLVPPNYRIMFSTPNII